MKNYITDPVIKINGKNKPERTIQNRINFMITSNEIMPV